MGEWLIKLFANKLKFTFIFQINKFKVNIKLSNDNYSLNQLNKLNQPIASHFPESRLL
jgi:hypothetical protein